MRKEFRPFVEGKLVFYQENESANEEDHEQNNEFFSIVEEKEHSDLEIEARLKKIIVSAMSFLALAMNFLAPLKKFLAPTMNPKGLTKEIIATQKRIGARTSEFLELKRTQPRRASGDGPATALPSQPGLKNEAGFALSPRTVGKRERGFRGLLPADGGDSRGQQASI